MITIDYIICVLDAPGELTFGKKYYYPRRDIPKYAFCFVINDAGIGGFYSREYFKLPLNYRSYIINTLLA
jgi:hypothetical protein